MCEIAHSPWKFVWPIHIRWILPLVPFHAVAVTKHAQIGIEPIGFGRSARRSGGVADPCFLQSEVVLSEEYLVGQRTLLVDHSGASYPRPIVRIDGHPFRQTRRPFRIDPFEPAALLDKLNACGIHGMHTQFHVPTHQGPHHGVSRRLGLKQICERNPRTVSSLSCSLSEI
ncbi:hypothetical protein D9M72_475560 [compost metagenome]